MKNQLAEFHPGNKKNKKRVVTAAAKKAHDPLILHEIHRQEGAADKGK